MVFGGGDLQISLVKKIRQDEYKAIVIDPDENAICKSIADHFEIVSGSDYKKTCQLVEKYKIDGIVTAATDKPLLMMARIAEKYEFSSFSKKAARLSTDKYLMKLAFKRFGIPHAKGGLFCRKDELPEFPCIIKPRDNSGSRGVIYCKDKYDYLQSIESSYEYTTKSTLLVEEYIDGPEYSVETIHYRGKSKIIQITEKITTDLPYNVELGHIQPADIPPSIQKKIEKVINKIAVALDFDNCVSHTELKIIRDNIVVIETSPRLGGDFITSHLVALSTGIDIEELLIKIILNKRFKIPRANHRSAAIKYHFFPEGKVASVQDVQLPDYVVGYEQKVKPGCRVKPIKSSLDRYGYIIVEAATRKDLFIRLNTCEELIKKSIKFVDHD